MMIILVSSVTLFLGLVLRDHFKYIHERRVLGTETRCRLLLRSLMRTHDVVNFVNAVVSTFLSSIVLFALEGAYWTHVTMRKENELVGWTVEWVCGYLLVELPFLTLNKYRLSRSALEEFRSSFDDILAFHGVALVGLLSVLLLDSGFVIAIWVIWSELTSVFLGIEVFFEVQEYHLSRKNVYALLAVTTTLCFIFQRFIVFLYLLWLCWCQFNWHASFLAQLAVLIVGFLLNVMFTAQRCYWTATWFWSNYAVRHKSVWCNIHESINPFKTMS
jgi:hypothetical protein